MKLTEITLNRFRGYRDKTTIPIGPHLTVLFGPNGFGKTTVLDGVEWLLSSQISRYVGSEEGRREDYLKHIDTQGEPQVELKFHEPDRQLLLRRERISTEKTKLSVGDANLKWLDSDMALSVLSNLDSNVFLDQLKSFIFSESFVSFHLLGQETLRGFVESDPRDRLERLAPIIGVHKYTELTESLITAARLLSGKLDESDRQLSLNKKELTTLQQKTTSIQETYEKSIQGDRNLSEWLREEFVAFQNSLPDRLRSQPQSVRQEDLREFIQFLEQYLSVTLAGIAQHHAETKSHLGSAEDLLRLGSTIQDRTQSVLSLKERVLGQAEELQKALLTRQVTVGRVNKQTNDLKTLGITQSKLRKDQESLIALNSILETSEAITSKLNQLNDKRRALQEQTSSFTSRIQNVEVEKNKIRGSQSDCLERLRATEASLAAAKDLSRLLQEVLQRTSQIASTQDALTKLAQERTSLTGRLRETHLSLQQAETKDRLAQQQLRAFSQNADKYHSLLAELRQFVADSRCPFCSTEFASREDLLARVNERLAGADPQIEAVAEEVRKLTKEVSDLRNGHQSLSEQLQRVERQIADSTAQIEDFNRDSQLLGDNFRSLGISLLPDLHSAGPALEQHLTSLQQLAAELTNRRRALDSSLKAVDEEHLTLQSGAQSSNAELAAIDVEIVGTQKELAEISEKRRQLSIALGSIELDSPAIEIRLSEVGQQLDSTDREAAVISGALSQDSQELAKIDAEIAPLQKTRVDLDTIERELEGFRSTLLNKSKLLRIAGTEVEITSRLTELTKTLPGDLLKLDDLLQKGQRFQSSVRAASQGLEISKLNKQIEELTTETSRIENEANSLRLATRFATRLMEKVREAGASRTNQVLKDCVSLAESYYNRIYPRPLWSEFDLRVIPDPSRGGRAQLRMGAKRSTKVPATDLKRTANKEINVRYTFSTGQLNLFALSIFLALAQQRGHEEFSTIFLDDPVQAMDDMRIVELCWVLINLSETKQLVVATGNQNFVELLLKRSMPISNRISVVVHAFESMTSKGPIININWRSNARGEMSKQIA